jgi:hypothetical protein
LNLHSLPLWVLLTGSVLSQAICAEEIIVIGDSWAEPVGRQLRIVLTEQGHPDVTVTTTPYWGGPRNLDTPEGFAAIEGWLEASPDANYLYMMMGQNNWLCCWTTAMIGTQEETDLFNSIISHTENVVAHIQSIRPDIKILWTAGEYLRPHRLGTPTQMNRNYDWMEDLAADYVRDRGKNMTLLEWNGLLQVTYGFNGVQYTEFDPNYTIPPGDPSLPDATLPSPAVAFENAAHPNTPGYKVMARALYDEYFDYTLNQQPFQINAGLNDAWYNPETGGQGFLITVFPDITQVFLAWFTFDTERPDPSVTAQLGDPGHRWLTALGPYLDNQAVLSISVTEGGVFDSATPSVSSRPDGEIILEFSDCENGTLSYDIPSIDRQGVIPIERITLDNVALCESLVDLLPDSQAVQQYSNRR